MKRKIISGLLSASLLFSGIPARAQVYLPTQEHTAPTLKTQSCISGFSNGYTLTGNGASDMAAIALAQEGRTGSQFGYTEDWCANFISDCAILANQTDAIPQFGGVAGLYDRLLSAGASSVSGTPKVGDLCFINWNGGTNMGHVEVVYAVSDGAIYTIGGNSGSADSLSDRLVKRHAPLSSKYILAILRPNYTIKQHNTLTYECYGGTGAPADTPFTDSVTVGQEIPLLEGHYFLGWSTDPACTDIHHLPGDVLTPSGNLTLYAVWAKIQCGEAMEWSMSGTHLKLTGSGDMDSFDSTQAPWYPLRYSIRTVTAEAGISSIGSNAFSHCTALKELNLGKHIAFIGNHAFGDCVNLADIYYEGTQLQWDGILIGDDNAPLYQATLHCHIHEFTTERQEPTCTEAGFIRSVCSLCGYTEEEILEPSGHIELGGFCSGCDTSVPEAPIIRSCYSKVQTSVKVSWNPISGADGYELWRTTDPAAPESWIRAKTISAGSKDYYTNKDLTVGQTYYYRLRSYVLSNSGEKIYSDFSPIAYMPAAVVADSPYSNGTDRIRLRWHPISGANGYQLWRQQEDGSFRIVKTIGDTGNVLTQDKGGITAYTNTGLIAGSSHTYKLRAFTITEDGRKIFGAYSDEFTVAVKPNAPILTAAEAAPNRTKLQWEQVNGAIGYQIWMLREDGFKIVKTVSSGEITQAVIYDLPSGQTCQFKIRAFSEADGTKAFSDYSKTVTVTVA